MAVIADLLIDCLQRIRSEEKALKTLLTMMANRKDWASVCCIALAGRRLVQSEAEIDRVGQYLGIKLPTRLDSQRQSG